MIKEFTKPDNVVAVAAHASNDPMHDAELYNSFKEIRSTDGSIPAFWVGDKKTTDVSDMTDLLSQTPVAGMGISSTNSGTSMAINLKIEFFEDMEGEYYLSVLVLESSINGSTSSGSYQQIGVENPSTYEHDYVLRASSVPGNAYGEMILTDPLAGETFEKSYNIQINSSWDNLVYPVAILWKRDDSTYPHYKYINAVR